MNRWEEIPPSERERIRETLDALEETFRPLAETLGFGDEAATIFDAAEESE